MTLRRYELIIMALDNILLSITIYQGSRHIEVLYIYYPFISHNNLMKNIVPPPLPMWKLRHRVTNPVMQLVSQTARV